jgi:hypothetical protein
MDNIPSLDKNHATAYTSAVLNVLLALGLFSAPARAEERPENSWPQTMTMHFVMHHQSIRLPPGYLLDIEKTHSEITRTLWFLAEGMQSEKIDFYLYPDRDSYLKGSFNPPPWSAGRSESRGYPNNKKIFVTYEGVRKELVKHELTHLFFAAYWKRPDGSPPPVWLNEGLAVTMEGKHVPITRPIPMREFIQSAPKNDDPAERVNDWYAQAGSVTSFLLKTRASYHFKSFLDSQRDGEPLVDALRHAYGFHSIEEFEKAWKSWAAIGLERAGSVKNDAAR